MLRTWLGHDHHDEHYWWARQTTAENAQSEREVLRSLANLLHVELASSRGRVHGTQFGTLDAQREWLRERADYTWSYWGKLHGVPRMTLALLRTGMVPL